METIEVRPWRVNGKGGYDLVITSPLATVDDYIRAMGRVEELDIYRSYRSGRGDCQSCPHCCGGRLPLTLRDVLVLRDGLQALTGKLVNLRDLIANYCTVQKMGPALDITLRTDGEGYCIFLSPTDNSCRLYRYRPLVCRTFYCCPATRRAGELRSAVINGGEDELVYFWQTGKLPVPRIYLRNLCSPALWKALRGR
ncbi:YkgJ family cysteine cluster protein [Thermanaeromonas sp. C210]|uniref:YkgJ family cysteine cluster protein n=1 Tax=Thermanaeromonas sp. C210 TaxID=2731925 RepID=UPI00155CA9E4|nr:YkgJ family cysteine cluster protein [Thermanaeromonas sp. C210]GFN23566.1 zinc/iron-chelating domain-containing protein [Thermanaeromonas sp. C210]